MGIWDVVKDAGSIFGGPIASVAGSVIDMITAQHANQANAQNVANQEAFQERMSDTQYQRGTADMRAAGINPALAYQQGGASAPAGNAAQAIPITQNTGQKLASAWQLYNEMATGTAQRNLIQSQANSAEAQADKTRKEAIALTPQALLGQQGDYIDLVKQSAVSGLNRNIFENTKYPERFRADIGNITAGTAKTQADTAEAQARTKLDEQGFQNEWFRKNISPFLNSAGAVTRALSAGLGASDQAFTFASKFQK